MDQKKFEKEKQSLLSEIPIEFREWAFLYAYKDGHSGGYEDILCILRNLIRDIKKPISDFAERMKFEA